MARSRVPVPFGAGLERATGVVAADPSRPRDLRDHFPRSGKLEARRGMTAASLLPAGTDVVAIVPLRTERIGLVCGYDSASGEVTLYRVNNDGTGIEEVGLLWTLTAGSDPPRIIGAQAYGKAFFAHDEPVISRRQETRYYDTFGEDFINTLEADLDGEGAAPVKFRGVANHLAYLVGWGYGTAAEPARPELVRISKPGEPTEFNAEHYFLAGQRGDPVTVCRPAGDGLVAHKEGESYFIFGYDRASFGIRPLDPLFGCLAGRLAVSVAGADYFWSAEGPRVTTGGASEDLALPLDLDAPDPSDLVAEGEVEDAFAEYLPERRAILFFFGRRVYCLSLWGGEPKWTTLVLGQDVFCAGRLFGGEAQAAVEGYPQFDSVDEGETTLNVHVTHVDAVGDEVLELWLQPAGGAWTRAATAQVTGAATQEIEATGLETGTTYQIALRYRRGTFYSPNSEDDSDPSLWPAPQLGEGTTVLPTGDLAISSLTWSRTSSTQEQIEVVATPDDETADINVYRRTGIDDFELIGTIPAGDDTLIDVSDDEGLADPNAEWGEKNYDYRLTHVKDGNESDPSAEQTVWAGPPAPTNISVVALANAADVSWASGDVNAHTLVWGPEGSQESPDQIEDPGVTNSNVSYSDPGSGQPVSVCLKHRLTSFTVQDFSSTECESDTTP